MFTTTLSQASTEIRSYIHQSKKMPLPYHEWSRIFAIVEIHENKVFFKNQFWNRLPAAFISHLTKKISLPSVKPQNGWALVTSTSDRVLSFIFQLQTCLHFKSWDRARHFSRYAKTGSTSWLLRTYWQLLSSNIEDYLRQTEKKFNNTGMSRNHHESYLNRQLTETLLTCHVTWDSIKPW